MVFMEKNNVGVDCGHTGALPPEDLMGGGGRGEGGHAPLHQHSAIYNLLIITCFL
jgi:hypothetical protein